MSEPRLTGRDPSDGPRGLVLILPGGADQDTRPSSPTTKQELRARLMARQLSGPLLAQRIGVWLAHYRFVGWNEGHPDHPVPSPIPDTRWALRELARRHPDLPVITVGHSMGGRSAVATADEANVAGVVALAPWLPEGEPVEPLTGRAFAAAHGSRDTVTDPGLTRDFTSRASAVASSAEFRDMGPVGHFLLRRLSAWNEFAVDRATGMLD